MKESGFIGQKILVKSRKVRGYFVWIINAEFWAELFFCERVFVFFIAKRLKEQNKYNWKKKILEKYIFSDNHNNFMKCN